MSQSFVTKVLLRSEKRVERYAERQKRHRLITESHLVTGGDLRTSVSKGPNKRVKWVSRGEQGQASNEQTKRGRVEKAELGKREQECKDEANAIRGQEYLSTKYQPKSIKKPQENRKPPEKRLREEQVATKELSERVSAGNPPPSQTSEGLVQNEMPTRTKRLHETNSTKHENATKTNRTHEVSVSDEQRRRRSERAKTRASKMKEKEKEKKRKEKKKQNPPWPTARSPP
ncbi:hypothetical protein C8J56DRAFT_901273 [Mycena floridula]|nr:hypothetical protein C8J56DRAFT_901273 [Mycena floridula]